MGGGAEIVNQLHESFWPNFPKLDVLLMGDFLRWAGSPTTLW